MTKKDYEMLARTFRMSLENNTDVGSRADSSINRLRQGARVGIKHTLVILCDQLAADNPRFDRRKFLFAATGSHDMHLELLEIED